MIRYLKAVEQSVSRSQSTALSNQSNKYKIAIARIVNGNSYVSKCMLLVVHGDSVWS